MGKSESLRRLDQAAGAADATREARSIRRVACGSQEVSCDPFSSAMLEELHRRNYTASTITYYINKVERFARTSNVARPPPPHPSGTYQAYLLRERKLCPADGEAARLRHPVLLQ